MGNMPIMKRFEGTCQGSIGNELFYQTWTIDEPKGSILVTHGLAEHSESYHLFAKEVVNLGYNVIAWDMAGHGKSEGKRGYISNFSQYCSDLKSLVEFLNHNESNFINYPKFLFGHSMGGLVTIRTLIEYGSFDFKGLVLSSPLLGVAVDVPKYKETFANIAGKWFPKVTLYNEISYDDLTRDQNFIEMFKKDPLRHDKISPPIFLGMLESMEIAFKNVEKIEIPTFVQLSGQDKIVSTSKAELFFERLTCKHKSLKIYQDSYHEIYNDLDRKNVFLNLKEFIDELL